MESDIQQFFQGKVVLLTGATGFLGKAFLEMILRTTQVARIYLLVRAKRNKDNQTRVQELLQGPLFHKVQLLKPNLADLITPVSGDCSHPMLGLSPADQLHLIQNVNVIIHSAATISFNEPLQTAIAINLKATMDLMDLAKQMPHLQSFVYVSTAFANCLDFHIEEKFYSSHLEITPDEAYKFVASKPELDEESAVERNARKFPNTYTFSKALTEEAIRQRGSSLPICIFRPGIIIPTLREPIEGWVDNKSGLMGIFYYFMVGLVRVKYFPYPEFNANIVPVDFCVNMMAACAWRTAQQTQSPSVSIYNLVPQQEHTINWQILVKSLHEDVAKLPPSTMLWKPFAVVSKSRLSNQLYVFLLHTIPAYLLDLCLLLTGQKPIWVKRFRKVKEFLDVFDYFVEHNFSYGTENTRRLWDSLSDKDKEIFSFDMNAIEWREFLYMTMAGIRLYVCKEDWSTLPNAKRLYSRFKICHELLKTSVILGLGAVLVWASLLVLR